MDLTAQAKGFRKSAVLGLYLNIKWLMDSKLRLHTKNQVT